MIIVIWLVMNNSGYVYDKAVSALLPLKILGLIRFSTHFNDSGENTKDPS